MDVLLPLLGLEVVLGAVVDALPCTGTATGPLSRAQMMQEQYTMTQHWRMLDRNGALCTVVGRVN